MSTRRASHASSWYSSQAKELNLQLEGWLAKAIPSHRPARAIIAPHAGYSYCGACAAHAYKQVDPSKVKRIFILGPSHHAYLSGCAVTGASVYQTPFYNLQVDATVTRELLATGSFETMSRSVDEEEHSIEMHLPYIAKVMESHRHEFTIIPILVGALSVENEKYYGKLLSKYLSNPDNFFVASSDFCHWGKRFRFTHHDKRCQSIHQSIHALDHMGMEIIERLDAKGFTEYLKKTGNTICGRHPISVLLYGLQHLSQCNGPSPSLSFKFLNYAQSSQVYDHDDSSVSYAAGVLNMSF